LGESLGGGGGKVVQYIYPQPGQSELEIGNAAAARLNRSLRGAA
jgi:hypothetical protein